MKKIFLVLILFLSLGFYGQTVKADNYVNLYFFYGDGCPHCEKEKTFLEKTIQENSAVKLNSYEVWHDSKNAEFLGSIGKSLNLDIKGVPLLIIGDHPIVGYFNDETTGVKIMEVIKHDLEGGCEDVIAPLMRSFWNEEAPKNQEKSLGECKPEEISETIQLPFLGEVDVKSVSLPVLTMLIAVTDGFNPCAMWVLLFLITMLLGMKNRKRMWILGLTFIMASALVYFLFLSAWLNLFIFIGLIVWVRIIIGLVAIMSGGFHLYDFYKNRPGCKVTSSTKRKIVFEKIKTIISKESLWLALIGIILLAFAVNLVELICSAGLPAVYTQLLALSNLPIWKYYAYLILYILVFMLDDIIVFWVAMTTLKITIKDSKYTRYAGLLGGIIILIIGILLIFKPGVLMFG